MNLSQVAVPPTYSGDLLTSAATITVASSNTLTATMGGYTAGLVHPYDLIQLNCQGPLYVVISGTTAGTSSPMTLQCDPTNPQQLYPWPSSGGVPFRIYRQPIKAGAAPLQLTSAAVVDLEFSGLDTTGTTATTFAAAPNWGTGNNSVIVMFSPNGGVDRIIDDSGTYPVTSTIYFLVGKREKVGNLAGKTNADDLLSQWVAINPQSGMITTTEAGPSSTGASPPSPLDSRQFAVQAQNMGGK